MAAAHVLDAYILELRGIVLSRTPVIQWDLKVGSYPALRSEILRKVIVCLFLKKDPRSLIRHR